MKIADELNGSWRAVYSELDGEMTPVKHFATIVIHFKNGTFQIESGGEVRHEGTYEVDETQQPAQITYTYSKSSFYKLNEPRTGIVQLTNKTMKDCLGAIGAPVPKGFNTKKDSGTVLTIHQKVGSEKGVGLQVSHVGDVSEW